MYDIVSVAHFHCVAQFHCLDDTQYAYHPITVLYTFDIFTSFCSGENCDLRKYSHPPIPSFANLVVELCNLRQCPRVNVDLVIVFVIYAQESHL